MKDTKYSELITSFIIGTITASQRERFNKLVEQGEIDILDVAELESLYHDLGQLPEPEPGQEMTDRFHSMLEEEKRSRGSAALSTGRGWLQEIWTALSFWRLSYGFIVLLVGMLIGNWATPFHDYRRQMSRLSSEVSQMREVMMMSLLDNPSATERLKAVNISSDIQSADQRVTEALLKTLNNDPNVNVRLSAVDALVKHASDPRVREGLIDAIDRQESPLVQSALADAMLQLQEQRSVREFKELLEQEQLDSGLRDKLKHTIAALI